MSWFKPTSVLDRVFEVGIIIKGISGALEFLGGLLLFFVGPTTMHHIVLLITRNELAEDSHDKLANFLLHSTNHITNGGRAFAIIYLWVHAAIKLIAVIGILKNQLWAYPFSLIALGLLVVYQLFDIFFIKPSIGMILLTIFDLFILWLIWREYGKVKAALAKETIGPS